MTWFSSLFFLLSNFDVNSIMLFDDDAVFKQFEHFQFAPCNCRVRARLELIRFDVENFGSSSLAFTSSGSWSAFCLLWGSMRARVAKAIDHNIYFIHDSQSHSHSVVYHVFFHSASTIRNQRDNGESNKTFNLMTFYLVDLLDEAVSL